MNSKVPTSDSSDNVHHVPNNGNRVTVLAMLAGAMLIVTSVLVVMLLLSFSGRFDAPVVYEVEGLQADSSVVCRGAALHYTFRLLVRRAPVIVELNRTIWNVKERRTQVFSHATEADRMIFNKSELDQPLERTRTYTVPLTLAPGEYELRSILQAESAYPAVAVLPFTVGPC